jgi:subtilase family serine protease
VVGLVMTVVVLIISGASGQAAESGLTELGRAPALPAGSSAVGPLPQTTAVNAVVTLRPQDPDALAAYADAVSTPGSDAYHQYLTVTQFAQLFGPTDAQIAAVRASLTAHGLEPGPPAADGLSIPVTASAGSLARAFSTSFERYRVAGGATGFANTSAPSVSTGVAGLVQGVVGLNSLAVPRPLGLASSRSPAAASNAGAAARAADLTAASETAPCSAASTQSKKDGSYTADQIASAYGLSSLHNAGDAGSGTTVALFELEPYSASDISAYRACYGTTSSVGNESVDGGAGTGSGSGEAALDIEAVIGLAPAAAIRVYEGPNNGAGVYETYAKIISDDTAQVVSTSWGTCESVLGLGAAEAENTLFEEAATQGQTVFAAAGDSGAQDCGGNSRTQAVDDPASQPYVTSIGGTTLPSSSGGGGTVWNDGYPNGAGGGGVSALWPRPGYQASAAEPQASTICGSAIYSCREVPDASADADEDTGYVIYYDGSWQTTGGTSAAAPTWAALAALADASPACDRAHVGFVNPALYQAALSSYSTYFNDVTSGNNTYHRVTGFSAGTGYDMASGLGTPKGAALVSAMCARGVPNGSPGSGSASSAATTIPPPTSPSLVTLSRPAAQTGRLGLPERLRLDAADRSGLSLRYAARGLPAGLAINARSGLISGKPTRVGRGAVSVTAIDSRGNSATVSFEWTVEGRPRVDTSLRRGEGGRPKLTVEVSAGRFEPDIRKIVVSAAGGTIRFSGRALRSHHASLARTGAGQRLKATFRVSGGSLVVTLRRARAREAVLRLSAPQISLAAWLTVDLAPRRGASVRLTVTVTDAVGARTVVRVRVADL